MVLYTSHLCWSPFLSQRRDFATTRTRTLGCSFGAQQGQLSSSPSGQTFVDIEHFILEPVRFSANQSLAGKLLNVCTSLEYSQWADNKTTLDLYRISTSGWINQIFRSYDSICECEWFGNVLESITRNSHGSVNEVNQLQWSRWIVLPLFKLVKKTFSFLGN